MPRTAKPGDKDYKGPVHGAVADILSSFGVKSGKADKPVPKPKPRATVPTRTLADSKMIAKGNMRNATASQKNKGTYSSYDPLSSIKTKGTMKKAIKRSKKAG